MLKPGLNQDQFGLYRGCLCGSGAAGRVVTRTVSRKILRRYRCNLHQRRFRRLFFYRHVSRRRRHTHLITARKDRNMGVTPGIVTCHPIQGKNRNNKNDNGKESGSRTKKTPSQPLRAVSRAADERSTSFTPTNRPPKQHASRGDKREVKPPGKPHCPRPQPGDREQKRQQHAGEHGYSRNPTFMPRRNTSA